MHRGGGGARAQVRPASRAGPPGRKARGRAGAPRQRREGVVTAGPATLALPRTAHSKGFSTDEDEAVKLLLRTALAVTLLAVTVVIELSLVPALVGGGRPQGVAETERLVEREIARLHGLRDAKGNYVREEGTGHVDAWGRPLRVWYRDSDQGERLNEGSPGPDGEWGSGDDILR